MSGQYDVFSPGQSISVISILSSSKMQSRNTFAASFIHDHSVLYGFGFPRTRTVQERATKQRQYPRLRAKIWITNFKENRSSGSSAQAIITSEVDLVEQYDLGKDLPPGKQEGHSRRIPTDMTPPNKNNAG
ncbi:alpha-1,3 mannosyltransferase [Histoplasma capsulatum G186AR]|uniref:Alpha-1,3 mannosyltransferase n=1 Tax=Ajellomyces capsulatus TaxID=5037 RepID=A0A8H8CXV6_AJECA|nr:alpha-1,3 mannosyltransferase [Histoplasma capsulatum]QSS75502.1 alpha-1,3 mannosyltransferase [Histoplasma capsulatum G186AR]